VFFSITREDGEEEAKAIGLPEDQRNSGENRRERARGLSHWCGGGPGKESDDQYKLQNHSVSLPDFRDIKSSKLLRQRAVDYISLIAIVAVDEVHMAGLGAIEALLDSWQERSLAGTSRYAAGRLQEV
jgi:hypothetical protein